MYLNYIIFYAYFQTKYVDIFCINKYYAWYSDCGQTELIQRQLEYEMNIWHQHLNKAIIVTEYGADTIAGLHQVKKYRKNVLNNH